MVQSAIMCIAEMLGLIEYAVLCTVEWVMLGILSIILQIGCPQYRTAGRLSSINDDDGAQTVGGCRIIPFPVRSRGRG
jgi:hypothetical protein